MNSEHPQLTLDHHSDTEAKVNGPVTCLGLTFENDAVRRAHFTEELRSRLQDPEFRKIEGFPIGSDEDILNLSDPPYYTACPNPWIADFIDEWEAQKKNRPSTSLGERTLSEVEGYHREPFAADVSEGKNDPIYNAHSYHTKVPHKAIMRYILHYTEPGDIVFDGFCGTGMTGVAAQMCGDREVVMSLGYQVKPDGIILQEETDEDGKKVWRPFSKLGARRAVLNDLSPAATFIAYNYNTPVDVAAFEKEAKRILKEVEEECGWMYETLHTDGKTKGKINYTVWSEIFSCPNCASELSFLDEALDAQNKQVLESFSCPSCGTVLSKKSLEKVEQMVFDKKLNTTFTINKRKPSIIVYEIQGKKFEKVPDANDLNIVEKISSLDIPESLPLDRMMHASMDMEKWGDKWRAGSASFTHVYHIFLPRAAQALGSLWGKASAIDDYELRNALLYWLDQSIWGFSILNRYRLRAYSHVNQYLTGVYYVPSQTAEPTPWYNLEGKLKRLIKVFSHFSANKNLIAVNTNSISNIPMPNECIDYIFTDPPFGDNLAYSELNFIVEAFLKVFTEQKSEAVISKSQRKELLQYYNLMKDCFYGYYDALKPGRWITVEFSNTKASVWNSIQTALTEAGFIVANVSALDKKQGSFNAVTNTTSVKQDLVISAYKPNGGFEERFQKEAQTEEGVWDFVHTHLKYLPVTKQQGALLQFVPERDPRICSTRWWPIMSVRVTSFRSPARNSR
ncbi:DNA methyltransferase [Nitrosomonas communis]|uniref:DNA methyltransferase n=1 Tax=Nitrosomonas communis TaxID=44574 RepID=UPI003D2B99C8